jgi:hypothetical protein
VRWRPRSGWLRVTLKKNRNAATELFMVAGEIPSLLFMHLIPAQVFTIAEAGDRPRNVEKVLTWWM